jgi:cytidylate kinase
MIITIDGPGASGKSSVAQEIARKLGIHHFSTGLLYRAVAYVVMYFVHSDSSNNHAVDIQNIDLSFVSEIQFRFKDGHGLVFFKGIDITEFLFDEALSQSASALSALPEVRHRLLDVQRAVAKDYDVIVDGRDCGSVVFPDADFKFFLTASVESRVQRILKDPNRAHAGHDEQYVSGQLIARDQRDSTRAIAPLVVPQDAVIIDSSDLTFHQTVDKFLEIIRKKAG